MNFKTLCSFLVILALANSSCANGKAAQLVSSHGSRIFDGATLESDPAWFHAGWFTISQHALDDGKSRYNAQFWELVTYLETLTFDSMHDESGCHNPRYRIEPVPFSDKQNSKVDVDPNKLKTSIMSGNTLRITAPMSVTVKGKAWLWHTLDLWITCIKNTICGGDIATLTTTFDLQVDVTLSVADGKITAETQPPLLNNLKDDVEGCKPDFWLKLLDGNWKQQLNDAIKDQIQKKAASFTQQWSAPTSYTPPSLPWLTMTYQPTSLDCREGNSLSFSADAFLTANGIPYVPNAAEAGFLIPLDIGTAPANSELLNQLSLSVTIAKALVWLADRSGATHYEGNATMLDAQFNTSMLISEPQLGLPSDGVLNITVASGSFSATCVANGTSAQSEGQPPVAEPVLMVDFSHVRAKGSVLYTDDISPGVYIRVDQLDLTGLTTDPIRPKLPLPASFQLDMVKAAIQEARPLLNMYLQGVPFLIPPQFLPEVAHPELSVKHLSEAQDNGFGFITLESICSCDSGITQFDKCENTCDSQKSLKLELFSQAQMDSSQNLVKGISNFEDHGHPNILDTSSGAIHKRSQQLKGGTSEVLLSVFSGSEQCFATRGAGVSLFSLPFTAGRCLPMSSEDAYFYSIGPNADKKTSSTRLSALCTDHQCTRCGIIEDDIASMRGVCKSIANDAGDQQSVSIGPLCSSSAQQKQGDYGLISYNPILSIAQQCSLQPPEGASNASLIATLISLGELNAPCSSDNEGQGSLYSQITDGASENTVQVNEGCAFSNCTECLVSYPSIAVSSCNTQPPSMVVKLSTLPSCDLPQTSHRRQMIIVIVSGVVGGLLFVGLGLIIFKYRKALAVKVVNAMSTLSQVAKKNISSGRKAFPGILTWLNSHVVSPIWGLFGWRLQAYRKKRAMEGDNLFWSGCLESMIVVACSVMGALLATAMAGSGDVLHVLSSSNNFLSHLSQGIFDASAMHDQFTGWIRSLTAIVWLTGFCLPILVVIIWPFTVFGKESSWSTARIVSVISALVSPVLLLIWLSIIVRLRDLVSVPHSPDSLLTDDSRGRQYTVTAAQMSSTGMSLTTIFFMFTAFFQGVGGSFQGLLITLLLHRRKWTADQHICDCVRVTFRSFAFLVLPLLQALVVLHPLILWTQDSGKSASYMVAHLTLWFSPAVFGQIVDKIVLKPTLHLLHFQIMHVYSNFLVSVGLLLCCGAHIASVAWLSNFIIHTSSGAFIPDEHDFLSIVTASVFVWSAAATYLAMRRYLRNYVPMPHRPTLQHVNHGDIRQLTDAVTWSKFQRCVRMSSIQQHTQIASPSLLTPLVQQIKAFREWMFEGVEAAHPQVFGWKVPFRRISLLVGVICLTLVTKDRMEKLATYSAREQVQNVLDEFHVDLQWPKNGTIFDNVFDSFNTAERRQTDILAAACALFWLSTFLDLISMLLLPTNAASLRLLLNHREVALKSLKIKSGLLWFGRACNIIAATLVFAMVVVIAAPDYLKESNLSTICPDCGPEFDAAVTSTAQFSVGLFFCGLFTLQMAPVLVSVPPALVRAATMMLVHPAIATQRTKAQCTSEANEKSISSLKVSEKASGMQQPLLQEAQDSESLRVDVGCEQGAENDQAEMSASKLLHRDSQMYTPESARQRALMSVVLGCAWCTVLGTFCSMSVVIHFTTDPFNSILVLLFWFVPPICLTAGTFLFGLTTTKAESPVTASSTDVSASINRNNHQDEKLGTGESDSGVKRYHVQAWPMLGVYYIGYIVTYFGLLTSLLVSTLNEFNSLHLLSQWLQTKLFYYELVSEIMLACVVLGDIMAICLG